MVLMLAMLASNLMYVQGTEEVGYEIPIEAEEAESYELPVGMNIGFPDISFQPTQQGVHDSSVRAHRLETRMGDRVSPVSINPAGTPPVVGGSLIWLRRPLEGSLERWFLIGHSGVIKTWYGNRTDNLPVVRDISVPEARWNHGERERITMFTILNPDTGLWDLINVTANEFINVGATAQIEGVGDTGIYRARFGNVYGVLDENGIRRTLHTYSSVTAMSNLAVRANRSDRAFTWMAEEDIHFPEGTRQGAFGRMSWLSPHYMAVVAAHSQNELYAVLSLRTGAMETGHEFSGFSPNNADGAADVFVMFRPGFDGERLLFHDNGISGLNQGLSFDGIAGEYIRATTVVCPSGMIRVLTYNAERNLGGFIINRVPVFTGFVGPQMNQISNFLHHNPLDAHWGNVRGGYTLFRESTTSHHMWQLADIHGNIAHNFGTIAMPSNNFQVINGYGFFRNGGNSFIMNMSSHQIIHEFQSWNDPEVHNNLVHIAGIGTFSTVTGAFCRSTTAIRSSFSQGNRTLIHGNNDALNERLEVIASGDILITPAMKTIWRSANENRTIIYDIDGNEINSHNIGFTLASHIRFATCILEARMNPIAINSQNFIDINGELMHPGGFVRTHMFHSNLAIIQNNEMFFSDVEIIDWSGSAVISGEFRVPFAGNTSIFNQRIIFEGRNAWYFFDFSDWDPAQPTGPIELIDTFPRHLSDNATPGDRDISLTFNRAVDFIVNPGVIRIREYETDNIVLTYDMHNQTAGRLVLYGNNRNTIILQNALTLLEYNTRYYVEIEGNVFSCPVPESNYSWFGGLSKGEFIFTTSAPRGTDTLTYIAANELLIHNTGFVRGTTVANHIVNGRLRNNQIWRDADVSFVDLFNTALREYTVIDYRNDSAINGRILVLRHSLNRDVIVVFDLCNNAMQNSDLMAHSLHGLHTLYSIMSVNFESNDIILTGNHLGGIVASYVGTLENQRVVSFGGVANMGIDLALYNNYPSVRNHQGIDRLNTMNYIGSNDATGNFVLGINNYARTVLRDTQSMSIWDVSLNRLYNFDGVNFRLNDVESSRQPGGVDARSVLNFESVIEVYSRLISIDILKEYINTLVRSQNFLVQGTSRNEPFSHFSLGVNVIYTGGASRVTSSAGSNIFVHSGGDVVIDGGNSADVFIIHNSPGTTRIRSLGSSQPTLQQWTNVIQKLPKLIKQDGRALAQLVAAIQGDGQAGRDTIYLQGVNLNSSMVTRIGHYDRITISPQQRVYVRVRPHTPMMVRGAGGSQLSLPPASGSRALYDDISENIELNLFNETVFGEHEHVGFINHTLIDGGNFTLTLYDVYGQVMSRQDVVGEDIFADDLWLLYVEGQYKFYVTPFVARARVEGRVFEDIFVHFNGEEDYLAMIEGSRPVNVVIDYHDMVLRDGITNNEISLMEKCWEQEVALENIIITFPYQLVYEEGEELNLEGLTVFACYSNGLIEQITEYEVSSPDGTVGIHIVQVTYRGKSAEFEVIFLETGTMITDIIVPEEIRLRPGEIIEMNIQVLPLLPDESQLVFVSDNPEVAELLFGFLYAFADGETIITITDSVSGVNTSMRVIVTNVLLGDINGDGRVNILDLQALLRHTSRREILTDERQLLAADVNRDGRVDILDLRLLLQYVSRRIPSLE